MKKNITINMFGMLFNIDEDAYRLLDNYLLNMKAYFSRRDGGEEIADDIERRVAELLSEIKGAGAEAITIEHIQDIMRRVGNPQEMDDSGEESHADGQMPPPPPPFTAQETPRRKLFRDGRDKMLGGVLSGMCKYFGGTSVLPWRLIFILLCFVSFWGVAIVYIVLWALIPEARTAEERLLMQGKPITQVSLNNEIMHGFSGSNDLMSDENQRKANGCLTALLTMLVTCLKVAAILLLVSLFIGIIVCVGFIATAMICSALGVPTYFLSEESEFGSILMAAPSIRWWGLGAALSGLAVVSIPLYALYRSFQPVRENELSPRKSHRGMFAVWLCALVVAVVTCIGFLSTTVYYSKLNAEKERVEYIRENTHDGRYLTNGSWEFLDESGWKLLELENAESSIYETGKSMESYLDEDTSWEESYIKYLNLVQANKGAPMRYKVAKRLDVVPGRYRIAAIMKTDGQGNAFYAKQGEKILWRADLHEYAATDTVISHRATDFIYRRASTPEMDSILIAQKLLPFEVEIDVPAKGQLEYGFSNGMDISNNPWTATCFSVMRMRIERVENSGVARNTGKGI